MRILIASILAGLTTALITVTDARAQASCTCQGKRVTGYQGGDGQPLRWLFEVYLVQAGGAGPALYCYSKRVTNASSRDVYAVKWDVANYRQLVVGAGQTASTCPHYLQDLGKPPLTGPLYSGISSRGYETTVIAPVGGWNVVVGGTSGPIIDPKTPAPRLTSQVAFTLSDKGQSVPAQFAVQSAVEFANTGLVTLYYVLANRAPRPSAVLVNLAARKELFLNLPFAFEPLTFAPGETKEFSVRVTGRVIAEPATIVIRGEDGETVVQDRVGVFAMADGSRARMDPELWAEPASRRP